MLRSNKKTRERHEKKFGLDEMETKLEQGK